MPCFASLQRDFLYSKAKVASLFWGPLDTSPLLSGRINVLTLPLWQFMSSRMLHDCRICSVKKKYIEWPVQPHREGIGVTVAFFGSSMGLAQTHLDLNLSACSLSELSLDASLSLHSLFCKTRTEIAPSGDLWRLKCSVVCQTPSMWPGLANASGFQRDPHLSCVPMHLPLASPSSHLLPELGVLPCHLRIALFTATTVFYFLRLICFREEREKERESTHVSMWAGGGAEEEEEENPKQTPRWAWSLMQGSISLPWDHNLRRNRESDAQLTGPPKAPIIIVFMSLTASLMDGELLKAGTHCFL